MIVSWLKNVFKAPVPHFLTPKIMKEGNFFYRDLQNGLRFSIISLFFFIIFGNSILYATIPGDFCTHYFQGHVSVLQVAVLGKFWSDFRFAIDKNSSSRRKLSKKSMPPQIYTGVLFISLIY